MRVSPDRPMRVSPTRARATSAPRLHTGISMVFLEAEDVASEEATQRWMDRIIPLDGSWTLQEYVKHPLLYRGRKFDMRVWAVITSIDPLRLFLLEHAFPKVSTVPYSPDAATVGRHCLSSARCACMHVRMPMGEGCDIHSMVKPYPPHTGTPLFKRGLRFGPGFAGRGSVDEEWTLWERVVLPQIARSLTTAVLLAREAGALKQDRLVQSSAAHKYRRVLLLSPDFIVDDSGVAFLEEVNTNGFLVGDENELYKAQGDTIDLMRIVGADGWPRRPLYSEAASELVSAFLRERGYDEHDSELLKPALKELIHEEVSASDTAWRRIFPEPFGLGHEKAMRQGPGFATDLDEATSDFLDWRARSAVARRLLSESRVNATAAGLSKGPEGVHG